jgi:hypothetical protein
MSITDNKLGQFRGDLEFLKFLIDVDGNVAVRVAPTITGSEGANELVITTDGQALSRDRAVADKLSAVLDELKEITFQLKLITGA